MRIGFYLGCEPDNPENIEKQLLAWGKYLENHKVEAYGSAPIPNSVRNYYDQYKMTERNPSNPISKIYSAFRHTREYIQERDPAVVVQVWCYPTHAPGVSIAASSMGTPSVVRFSGDHFREYRAFAGIERGLAYALHNIIGRIPLRLSERVITLGPSGRKEVVNRGANSANVDILPPAAGLENRFSPPTNKKSIRRDLGLPEKNRIILYVGRLSKRKGMPFLLDVIDTLSDDGDITFILVGSGEYRDKIKEEYPRSLVRTPGKIPYQEIHKYFRSADIYVHPSEYEGIPLTILEALSCEVPVIARKAGDIAYVINTVVDTPSDMAKLISDGQSSVEWKNKKKFSSNFQKETLQRIIESVV